MSKKVYESAVLINAALKDEQIQSIVSHIKEIILNSDGKIIDIEDWGRKRLAYVIKKSKIGYYVIFRFNALPSVNSKLERFYKLDENILRYLTIKLSETALEQIEKNKPETSVIEKPVSDDISNLQMAEEKFDESIETEENS
ncbi:MAG: 30S ribosomal protein S6 [Bacteroidetes bacterium]|nr:30S ribosomal protein S6 [Bacteroidota bacterium]